MFKSPIREVVKMSTLERIKDMKWYYKILHSVALGACFYWLYLLIKEGVKWLIG